MTAYQLRALLLCWASSLAICAYRAHDQFIKIIIRFEEKKKQLISEIIEI